MKFWILIIIGVVMCSIEFTWSEDVKPANKKKKNINIELNVNLGLGNDSGRCAYKCMGPCYPGCPRYPPGHGYLTPITNTPRHRNMEKVGEYIKVRLCSYLYDDGKTCEFYCALLGYLRYTCVDLDTCHCFKKSNFSRATTKGVIWENCTDDNDCMDYCSSRGYDLYYCRDEMCQCSYAPPTGKTTEKRDPTGEVEPTNVLCNLSEDNDYDCLEYCHEAGYNDYECLPDRTCRCFNTDVSTVATVSRNSLGIGMPCDDSKMCHDYCIKEGYDSYRCRHDDTCDCYDKSRKKSCEERCMDTCQKSGYPKGRCTDGDYPGDESENEHCDCYFETSSPTGTYATAVMCTESEGADASCQAHCKKEGFDSYECLEDGTCTCHNHRDKETRTTEEDTTETMPQEPDGEETTKNAKTCDEKCTDFCLRTSNTRGRCADPDDPDSEPNDDSCDCYSDTPSNEMPPAVLCTEREDIDIPCQDHCNSQGFDSYECLENDTCSCYDHRDRVKPRAEEDESHATVRNRTCSEECIKLCHDQHRPIAVCGEEKDSCECYAPPPPAATNNDNENPETTALESVDTTIKIAQPVKCTEFDVSDIPCQDHCNSRGFDSSECLKNETCSCYNSRDRINPRTEADKGRATVHNRTCSEECIKLCHDQHRPIAVCGEEKDSCECYAPPPPAASKSEDETPKTTEVEPDDRELVEDTTLAHKKPDAGTCNPKLCQEHCQELGFQESECLIDEDYPDDIPDEPCHCIGSTVAYDEISTKMSCEDNDGKCKIFCDKRGFTEFECGDGVCQCYNSFGIHRPTTEGNQHFIPVPCTWEDEGKRCSSDCKIKRFQVFECLGDGECHCFKPDLISEMKPFAIRYLDDKQSQRRKRLRARNMFQRRGF